MFKQNPTSREVNDIVVLLGVAQIQEVENIGDLRDTTEAQGDASPQTPLQYDMSMNRGFADEASMFTTPYIERPRRIKYMYGMMDSTRHMKMVVTRYNRNIGVLRDAHVPMNWHLQ